MSRRLSVTAARILPGVRYDITCKCAVVRQLYTQTSPHISWTCTNCGSQNITSVPTEEESGVIVTDYGRANSIHHD